jgi:hypothetical protein
MIDTLRNIIGVTSKSIIKKAEIELVITTWFGQGNVPVLFNALPANLQTKIPVWLFGLTDYYGNYSDIASLVPPLLSDRMNSPTQDRWQRYDIPLLSTNAAIYGFGFYDQALMFWMRQGRLELGDMFLIFMSLGADWSCMVKIHCNNMAYGTFLNSYISDRITINRMKIIIPTETLGGFQTIDQFKNPLILARQSLFGTIITDNLDPRLFITSHDMQQHICDIPLKVSLDKNFLMGFLLEIPVTQMQINLYVSKVEPLLYIEDTISNN